MTYRNMADILAVTRRADLTAQETLVAVAALSFRNPKTGQCNPPVETDKGKESLCSRSKLCRRQVFAVLKSLQAKGVLTVEKIPGKPSRIVFAENLEAAAESCEEEEEGCMACTGAQDARVSEEKPAEGCTTCTAGVHTVHPRGACHAPEKKNRKEKGKEIKETSPSVSQRKPGADEHVEPSMRPTPAAAVTQEGKDADAEPPAPVSTSSSSAVPVDQPEASADQPAAEPVPDDDDAKPAAPVPAPAPEADASGSTPSGNVWESAFAAHRAAREAKRKALEERRRAEEEAREKAEAEAEAERRAAQTVPATEPGSSGALFPGDPNPAPRRERLVKFVRSTPTSFAKSGLDPDHIPQDWEAEYNASAKERGIAELVQPAADAYAVFVDYYTTKRRAMACWPRAFFNWVEKDFQYQENRIARNPNFHRDLTYSQWLRN